MKPAVEKRGNAGESPPKAGADKQYSPKGSVMPGTAGKAGKKKGPAKPVKQVKKKISKPSSIEEKTLYPSGAVNIIWTKKNGKNDGPYKRFYESGAIGQKGSYSKGAKDGDWNFYRENGFMFKTMIFDMDVLVLESTYSPPATDNPGPGKIENSLQYVGGKLYRETIFKNGKPKTMKYYDKDGQVVSVDKL
jgi:antitoxin component YwqK of YwqJK toxin-antitoxin module